MAECLKQLAEYYELVVFTASHPYYADVVIDLLDPEKKLFSKRLFRSSCIHTDNGLWIKDLRILNCDMKSTVIVDNAIFSFAFQLDNGIPMIPFYDDKDDHIMPKIRDYLLSLKDLEDVRVINRKTFSLMELKALDVASFYKYYLDNDDKPDEKEEDAEPEEEQKLEEGHAELQFEDMDEDEPELIRRKSYSFAPSSDHNPFKIGKRAQAAVDNQLEKLKQTLSEYYASKQKDEVVKVAEKEHKHEC